MNIKDFVKKVVVKIRLGRAFDPRYQERTDAMDDIARGQAKRGKGARVRDNKRFKGTPSPK